MVWIVLVTLIALSGVVAILAIGGRPDPFALRAVSTQLDGPWRFHVALTLSPRPASQSLYRVEWWRTIAGYIVELVEPFAILALVGLALAVRSRSSRPSFITFACLALVLWGLKRLDNAIVSWTDLMSLPTYSWLSTVLWTPLSLTVWALAWNRWCERSSRIIDAEPWHWLR